MDFWSRLLSHASLTPGASRKDAAARDPAKRLHRFEREYGRLLQIWRSSTNLPRDGEAAEKLEARLRELTAILADETRRPLPHPCIQFASIKQIYVPIGKIATTSYNEWIIKEAVHFFATLVESEEEAFVENHSFSASLTNLLVRITGQNSVRLGRDTEAKVVELAFNITTKIRLLPDILDVWFKTHQAGGPQEYRDDRERFAGRMQKQDFPLFYVLMDYIQHEGRVGDFARTGLLYIIECASKSVALEQWIVESDLSTLMATGLGALYSQLSRKLVVDYLPHELPPVLALSDYQHPTSNYEIVASCSPEFQAHLETFLSHLLFWQDVLNHCRSVEVKSTLLEHFQVIFLQQLLYPSLLESSDIDGGSSVAVITYLRRILESLDHPDMINLVLHYLLHLPDPKSAPPPQEPESTEVSNARKRKSLDLATMMAESTDLSVVTPLLFNLVDLTLACLRSHSQQTIRATLRLVSAILKRHHRYAVLTLLRTEAFDESGRRTSGAHNQEVEFLMSLAGSVGGQDDFDEVFENTLQDAMTRLESHPCSLKLVAPKVSTNNHEPPVIHDSLPGAPPDVASHTLRPDDPLLGALLDILETFFVNPVDTNLAVTETVTDLAICGYMGVEGWLLRAPASYIYEEDEAQTEAAGAGADEDPEGEKQRARRRCRRRPKWSESELPRILTVLSRLSEQVAQYREIIPRFDELLQQRREAFQTADSAPGPRETPAEKEREGRAAGEESPRPSALEGLAQRILGDLGSASRSGSPRRERGLGGAAPGAPREFPMGEGRGVVVAGEVEDGKLGKGDGKGKGDRAVSGQVAAFAAVDQGILARRVGIPKKAVVPLSFEGKKGDEQGSKEAEEQKGGDEGAGPESEARPETETAAEGEGEQQENVKDGEGQGEGDGEQAGETAEGEGEEVTVSVSHVLTNALILQSFLMELAGLVQVRAGLFNEVRYT